MRTGFFPALATVLALLGLGLLRGAAEEDTRHSADTAGRREELRTHALKNPGDAKRGSALLEKLDCRSCHVVGGSGGKFGPSLDDVGSRLSRQQIADQLLDPSRGRSVRVDFADGRSRTFVLVEDGAEVLKVRDRKGGAVQEFKKAELAGYTRIKSDMPPDLVKDLAPTEFSDLVAFLTGLRK